MVLQIPVDEYTTPCPVTTTRHCAVWDVAELMKSEGVRHVPVIEDGVPVGVISERDVRAVTSFDGVTKLRAEDVMRPSPFSVDFQMPLEKVAFELSQRKIGSALVTDEDGRLRGIFTATDALNALIEVIRGDVDCSESNQSDASG